jgi:hypothetical protein
VTYEHAMGECAAPRGVGEVGIGSSRPNTTGSNSATSVQPRPPPAGSRRPVRHVPFLHDDKGRGRGPDTNDTNLNAPCSAAALPKRPDKRRPEPPRASRSETSTTPDPTGPGPTAALRAAPARRRRA